VSGKRGERLRQINAWAHGISDRVRWGRFIPITSLIPFVAYIAGDALGAPIWAQIIGGYALLWPFLAMWPSLWLGPPLGDSDRE